MSSKFIKNFFLILIFLVLNIYCSNGKNDIDLRGISLKQEVSRRPGTPPKEHGESSKESEEDKFKKDLEEKMKENLLLKQQIEDKLKYIKILLSTGVIMLIIIIFILVKNCFCKKKKKIRLSKSSSLELPDKKKNKIKVDRQRSEIEDSSYNILNGSLKNSTNISSNDISFQNNSNFDNNNINEENIEKVQNVENVNNLNDNSNKVEEFNNESINDDNKTLTNNPDVFIQSKTDKILYQPYSNEEIYNSDNDKK